MPSWFEDHLGCAPLGSWLPQLVAGGGGWLEHGASTPGRLARLLSELPRVTGGASIRGALVHTAPLHVPPPSREGLPLGEIDVVVDLAWVAVTARWWRLRPWRRAPLRRDVTDRLAWIVGLGLVAPQQWTCSDPMAVVVTLGRRRR